MAHVGPPGGCQPAGRGAEAVQGAPMEPRAFAFSPARVVRVRGLANPGGADSTSLAEVALLPAAG